MMMKTFADNNSRAQLSLNVFNQSDRNTKTLPVQKLSRINNISTFMQSPYIVHRILRERKTMNHFALAE